ncbi:M23 family metallopeptidase [Microbacterium sediminicola]|uniref:M23 family metallopeptidase n=1 Tax=Microbacterium sediminicola TaxID=415210 RepID=UPI0031E05209
MTSDSPAAESAPSRRSRRTASLSAQAAEESTPEVVVVQAPAPLTTIPVPVQAGDRARAHNTADVDVEPAAPRASSRRAARLAAAEAAAEARRLASAPATEPIDAVLAEVLTEPVIDAIRDPLSDSPAVVEPESVAPAAASEPALDEFEAAVRALAMTVESPIVVDAETAARVIAETASADDGDVVDVVDASAVGLRGRIGSRFGRVSGTTKNSGKKLLTTSFSIGVMGTVGLLAVGMTTPLEAVAAANAADATSVTTIVALTSSDEDSTGEDIQAYVAPAEATTTDLVRSEGYAAVSLAEIAAESGVRDTSDLYTNNTASAVQYPFPVGVPISDGFGIRWGYLHAGVDFIPGGEGAEIHAIADGVVRVATEAGASYGVHVIIDHIVDGEVVSSHYAHMQYGSLQVSVGDVVHVGDVIGTVGTTGHSTGPHLHFEILLNGVTPTEPLTWMAAHNVADTVVTMPDGILVSE